MAEVHPVDAAHAALLDNVSGEVRKLLESRIHIARGQRQRDMHAEDTKIVQEHGSRGAFNSSVTLTRLWDAIVPIAERTRTAIIAACLDVRVCDDGAIVAFVAADMRHCLTAFMQSRGNSMGAAGLRMVADFEARATALASQVPHQLRADRDAHLRSQGTMLGRLTNRATDHPVIAWVVLIYVILTSALGTWGLITDALNPK